MDDNAQAIRRQVLQKLFHYITLFVGVLVTGATSLLLSDFPQDPQAYHTSILTGEGWVRELLAGHPERIRRELGVHTHVFLELIEELHRLGHDRSKYVSLEEQLAIFLYISVTGITIRHAGERFQRSNETISRYFRHMLCIFSSYPFYTKYVILPTVNDPVPPEIRHNSKFWPYFKDALGAIDGSHIHCSPPASQWSSYQDRKGGVSQNCLFACSFDLQFVFTYTGWEGSATDARVYESALMDGLDIPLGKYYLADAGFPSTNALLIPYRSIRYHLAEWGRANVRPKNKEELFNLRHASARNVIEHIFGVLKKHFRILLLAPEYSLEIQARIPSALSVIHNFIRIHDSNEGDIPAENGGNSDGSAFERDHVDPAPAAAVNDEPSARQDAIASMMWADYVAICREREDEEESGSGDESGSRSYESRSDEASGDDAE